MPHYVGRDENGYLHNWWDYILDLKYVKGLESNKEYPLKKIVIPLGTSIADISFSIKYNTGKKIATTVAESGAVIKYDVNNVFSVCNGTITAMDTGTEKIVIMYDGHSLEYQIEVPEPTYEVIIINGSSIKESKKDEKVSITADKAEEGMYIKCWKVTEGNVVVKDATAEKTTFVMPGEKVTIEAVYEMIPKYKVEVIGGKGSTELYAGLEVTVTADKAEEGMYFKCWEVTEGNVVLKDATAEKTTFVMPSEDVVIVSCHEKTKYEVTVINGTGNIFAYAGEEIVVANIPGIGMKFDGWNIISGDIVLDNVNESEAKFTMPTENVILKATYIEEIQNVLNDDTTEFDNLDYSQSKKSKLTFLRYGLISVVCGGVLISLIIVLLNKKRG